MIEIKGISKRFGKLQVLNNVNLECIRGECIALIGPNGCGKTTLIKILSGAIKPTSGSFFINDDTYKKIDLIQYRINLFQI